MPIYEFYCPDCNTIFSFLSVRVDTKTRPDCPRCGRPRLDRQASVFSVFRGGGDSEADILEGMDESRMEKAMSLLAREGAGDEEDPRAAARLMRQFSDAAGMEFSPAMQEAMRRMEAGEDPDTIEAELGDVLEAEDPFILSSGKKGRQGRTPERDETLYDL
ncbi:MAG: FmdB family zinc ribbon protein [Desulfovibrionales bacterium]